MPPSFSPTVPPPTPHRGSSLSTRKSRTATKSNFQCYARAGIVAIGLLYILTIYYTLGSWELQRDVPTGAVSLREAFPDFYGETSAQSPLSGRASNSRGNVDREGKHGVVPAVGGNRTDETPTVRASKSRGNVNRDGKHGQTTVVPAVGGNLTDETPAASNEQESINHSDGIHFAYHRSASDILQSPKLPEWVKTYAAWHAEQRRHFSPNSIDGGGGPTFPPGTKFLIIRCLRWDHCGGASDRLQDMPYNLMLANRTNRVLLVKWERPVALERFLIPTPGGIDWTVPDGLFEGMDIATEGKEESEATIVSVTRRGDAAPMFRVYEKKLGQTIYHEIFRLLFTPSKELSTRIETTMNSLHLVPKQYSSVHLRVKYPYREIKEKGFTFKKYRSEIEKFAINAVNCAAKLHPRSTIYVSSDNNDTVAYLLEDSHFAKHASNHAAATAAAEASPTNSTPPPLILKLVSRDYSTENPHVEFSKNTEAGSFMSVFEDLMIMGLGKCVAHGVGGYGRLSAALSGGECVVAHRGRHSKTCSDVIARDQAAGV